MGRKRKIAEAPLRMVSRLAAPLGALTARTGIGSDEWMRRGVLPVADHYYQPIFNPAHLPSDTWAQAHSLAGVELRFEEQRHFLKEVARYAGEPQWPEHGGQQGYYWRNASFSYSSAIVLYAIVRHLRPQRVIEVGAGMSTLVLSEALQRNGNGRLTTIEPYPEDAPRFSSANAELIRREVQRVDLATFARLEASDLLFIDSSHVVKIGSDVNYLYLDVLPRLQPGVIVHVHDIQLPYEYWRDYSARTSSPRVFWTEQYLLQAVLQDNPRWRVLLAGYLWQRDHQEEFRSIFPGWDPAQHRPTTSFYIQRR